MLREKHEIASNMFHLQCYTVREEPPTWAFNFKLGREYI